MNQMLDGKMDITIKLSTLELPYKPGLNQIPDQKMYVNFYAHEICSDTRQGDD